MAAEFDPCWNKALAEQPWDSPDENLSGSLNFVIKLLYHKVSERIDYKTKIINRHAKWASRYPPIGLTFYGCGGEYIEIPLQHWQRWRRCSIRLVEGSALLDFFDYFVSLFYFRLQEIYCETHGLSFGWESDMKERDKFDIRDHFSILVLRSNQVDYVQNQYSMSHNSRVTEHHTRSDRPRETGGP